jgi:hypothetical protein
MGFRAANVARAFEAYFVTFVPFVVKCFSQIKASLRRSNAGTLPHGI